MDFFGVELPAPGVGDGLFDRAFGLPVEFFSGFFRAGEADRHVAWAAWGDFVGEVAADDLTEDIDNFEDGGAGAGAEVVSLEAGFNMVEGGDVAK